MKDHPKEEHLMNYVDHGKHRGGRKKQLGRKVYD